MAHFREALVLAHYLIVLTFFAITVIITLASNFLESYFLPANFAGSIRCFYFGFSFANAFDLKDGFSCKVK